TSRSDAMRPFTLKLPVVGLVTLLSSFKSVLFPAPFRPMMPTASPCSISKLISRKDQTYSLSPFDERSLASPIFKYGSSLPRILDHIRFKSWLKVPVPTSPSRYCFDMFSAIIAKFFILNGIHETLFDLVENDD